MFSGDFIFNTKKKAKLILKIEILDCVIDLRKNSKTFGKTFKIILSKKKYFIIYT